MTKDSLKKISIFGRIRTYFLTGLVIAAPIAITIYATLWVVDLVDAWVLPFIPKSYLPETYLQFSIPGIGLIIAFVALVLLGAVTANFVGRYIVNLGTGWLEKMPVVRTMYKALKQIFETVVSQGEKNFKQVVIVEYPRRGIFAIAFVATETKGEVGSNFDEDMVSVFLPTTPNPTSGFLLFVPKKDVKFLDMSVEDGAKLVISAGLVNPEKLPVKDDDSAGAK
ncbi:MAG: DUF502 domain-containing protein [Rhizobiales bacterium]|nr:DUF502 domain-containing protein [Hyphomicrobiales bacterium]NRB14803.1 DUF502 domain-containing protein [Hyphomicrobiales bacterium]